MNNELRANIMVRASYLGEDGFYHYLPKENIDSLYQLVVEQRIAELEFMVGMASRLSSDYMEMEVRDLLSQRIKELQSQLSSIGESKWAK